MPQFDQEAFNRFVLDNNAIGFFEKPLTLKSGRQSHLYVNWRTVVSDVWLTEKLVGFVTDFVRANEIPVDTFYGVPEGATKLGVLTQYAWAHSSSNYSSGSHTLAMGRAKPKDHGAPQDRYFVGAPKGRVAVLEDTTTTGGALITTLEFLRDSGVDVAAVITLTDRMEKRDDGLSVRQAVEAKGFKYYSLSRAPELLPELASRLQPSAEVIAAIESEYRDHGVQPVVLK